MTQSSPSWPNEVTKRLAWYLTRRYRAALVIGCMACLIAGILHAVFASSPTAFPRYGALITVFTLWHAFAQFRYMNMMELDAEPVGLEVAKALGKTEGAARKLAILRLAIQRRFVIDHLTTVSLGTFVWGFGDLPFYWGTIL
jgi:hypothetical protein